MDDEMKVIVGDIIGWELEAAMHKGMIDYYTLLHALVNVLLEHDHQTARVKINALCDTFELTYPSPGVSDLRERYNRKAENLKPQPMPDFMKAIMNRKKDV